MKFIEQVSRLFIRSDKNPPLSQELNGLSNWLSVSLLAVLNWKPMPIQWIDAFHASFEIV